MAGADDGGRKGGAIPGPSGASATRRGAPRPAAPLGWFPRHSILPGFGLSLGITLLVLSIIVLLPLAAMMGDATSLGWPASGTARLAARSGAFRVSLGCSLLAAVTSAIFGLLIAWVLVRYRFPGRRLVDALVDLPFALPTAVAGIALATLYAPTAGSAPLLAPLGIKSPSRRAGICRRADLHRPAVRRAHACSRCCRILRRRPEEAAATPRRHPLADLPPRVLPAPAAGLLTGFALAFARALGEYGSVIFIAGNMPMLSEITPLLIVTSSSSSTIAGAAAIAVVMLVLSFACCS